MPICYQLIGVPGSGKTTWAENKLRDELKDCVYASTDLYVEKFAYSVNKTYNEVFDGYMKSAVKLMTDQVIHARDLGQDIIWDQTSTTVVSRRKKFNLLPDYEHIAVVFPTPEPKDHARRLAQRPFKIIPQDVLDRMIFDMGNEPPTLSEGFTRIVIV